MLFVHTPVQHVTPSTVLLSLFFTKTFFHLTTHPASSKRFRNLHTSPSSTRYSFNLLAKPISFAFDHPDRHLHVPSPPSSLIIIMVSLRQTYGAFRQKLAAYPISRKLIPLIMGYQSLLLAKYLTKGHFKRELQDEREQRERAEQKFLGFRQRADTARDHGVAET